MPSIRYLSSLLLSLVFLRATSTAPTGDQEVQDCPEVIPGPGLPSLASLNLTSAQLCAMGVPESLEGDFQTLFEPRCGPSDAAYTNVNGIISCFHYLDGLGTRACKVPGNLGVVEMCRSGDGHVIGQGITGNQESSYCRDVAKAVLWVIDHCTRQDQSVAGFQAANGNGNLIVGGTRHTW